MNFADILPIYLDEIDSTNAEAMRMLKQGKPAEGTCIIAGFQREGRGQRSNVWASRPGENLLVSFILYPRFFAAQQPFILSKTIALAVHNTIATFSSGDVRIKWPNDILIDGKKVAGVLLENQWAGSNWQAAIAGIGINVNQTKFAIEKATSLATHSGNNLPVNSVLKELQMRLSHQYARLCNGEDDSITIDYHQQLFGKDHFNTYQTTNEQLKAKVIRVADDGRLEILSEKGNNHLFDLSEVRLLY